MKINIKNTPYWFKALGLEEQEKVLKAMKRQKSTEWRNSAEEQFAWADTPEGYQYWAQRFNGNNPCEGQAFAYLPEAEREKLKAAKDVEELTAAGTWVPVIVSSWSPNKCYRIAKPLAYRPYTKGAGHVGQVIKHKRSGTHYMILASSDSQVSIDGTRLTYEELLADFEHLNGAPCGVKA